MISFEKAYKIIMDSTCVLDAEQVLLIHSLNRVLACEIKSDTDIPPFNRATMDGYDYRKADLHAIINIIDVIPV
jgi:molybdopterin molybdotransferase